MQLQSGNNQIETGNQVSAISRLIPCISRTYTHANSLTTGRNVLGAMVQAKEYPVFAIVRCSLASCE